MYKTFRELSSKDMFYDTNMISLGDLHEINNNSLSSSSSVENSVSRSLNSVYSKFRVPFGNIYNGNKEGRCFYTTKREYKHSYIFGELDNTKQQYYEGNYLYKKKVLPLRYLVAQIKELTDSEFIADC